MSFPRTVLRRTLLLLSLLVLMLASAVAQIPTQCLEIESILVDACNPSDVCPGGTEGQNEMVRFITGPIAIALNELEADWPNNPWRGLVQNATTASITAQLNATIVSCGFLIEPPNGVIPPGSTVLLVTSPEMCVAGNSFASLTDTLYLIFQATGNTQGHFANSTASGQPISPTPPAGNSVRTLTLTYLPSACTDEVSYVRELLVNDLGSYGGQSGENDGSTVVFSWPGDPVASYVNYGCQAPFEPLIIQAEVDGSLCGGTGTVTLTGEILGGSVNGVLWSGGTGTFADPTALVTTYTAGSGDTGDVELQLCATTDCAQPICSTIIVPAGDGPTVIIEANGPLSLCPGDQLELTAVGADSYQWSTSATTASITVNAPGTYSVTGTNACGTGTTEVEVTSSPGIVVDITGDTEICPGESTVLTATGAVSYVWSTQETTTSISVDQPGTYSVTGTNGCGTAIDFVTVTQAPGPAVSISGDTSICPGESTVLTATGADTYVWNTTETTPSITVSTAGTYTATGTNGCGSATGSITVVAAPGPSVTITGDLQLCPGETSTLTANGADSYAWSTTATTASISVNTAGTFSVTGTNGCGTGTASAIVVQQSAPTVSVVGDTVICPGATTVLTAQGTGPFTWSNGQSGPSITVSQPGNYAATATNACGAASDEVTVRQVFVTSAFAAQPTSGSAPLNVFFNNGSVPESASFDWDFDDGASSSATDPSHVYTSPGSYVVTLEVTAEGCSASTTRTVVVTEPVDIPESTLIVPNVFTPNGDRDNDVYALTAVNISSLNMRIFNRWGQLVTELDRVGEVWDARSLSGNQVPEGTYFYTLVAKGLDGKSYDLSGHLTVLR